jgi:hypothetical protein
MSVVLHGSAIGLIVRKPPMSTSEMSTLGSGIAGMASGPSVPMPREPRPVKAPPTPAETVADEVVPEKITFEELDALHQAGELLVLLDVRTPRTFEADPFIAHGAIRMPPDDAVRLANTHRIPWKATLVAYCA